MPRQLPSSFAPPLWHSSMMIKSKKSGGYSPKYGVGFSSLCRAAHECLENGEEDAAVFRDVSLFYGCRRGLCVPQCVFGERGKVIEGLIRENVAIGEEQHARSA